MLHSEGGPDAEDIALCTDDGGGHRVIRRRPDRAADRLRSVPNLLKLPTNMYLGEVSGVAVNSKGHIFAFSRGNNTGPAYARRRGPVA